uniref:Uncharacterized protein n=1 Tax=Arundo donax TaxID=35708 RepID=A0A0A9BIE7_ARUDO
MSGVTPIWNWLSSSNANSVLNLSLRLCGLQLGRSAQIFGYGQVINTCWMIVLC